jgi:hypothetical protein
MCYKRILKYENTKSHLRKKVASSKKFLAGYFLFNQSLTNSGAITASVKVYAPDFSDFTILIALVKRFEPVCNDATDFFAMSLFFI